jgi:hypothetical protein
MKFLAKSLLSAGAAAAAMVGATAPLQAGYDRYDRRHNDGISAGEVIAGAVILGGIAAVIASADKKRGQGRDYDDRSSDSRSSDSRSSDSRSYDNQGYDNNGYDRQGGYNDNGYHGRRRDDYDRGYGYGDQNGGSRVAVNLCINSVQRWASRYSRADVTQIQTIDRTRLGYRVSGNLVVRDNYQGHGRYNRGYDRGYNQGRFTCFVERGRVIDIDYRGLDQWR